MTSHAVTTAEAAPRWTPSATLRDARSLKGVAFKALFYLRHEASTPMSASELARSIGCSLKGAYLALQQLETAGLARPIGGCPARYEPT